MATLTQITAGTSMFWSTNPIIDHGTSVGHGQDDYGQDILMQFYRALFGEGVIFRDGTELRVKTGLPGQIKIEPGWAIVHGFWYWLSTTVDNIEVDIPDVGTTGGYVVLHVSWDDQTVYPAIYLNDESDPQLPDLLQYQNTGTEYVMPLYSFTIDETGTVILTDMRVAAGVPAATPFNLSAYNLGDLGDVDIGQPEQRTDGDALLWDASEEKWVLETAPPPADPQAVISGPEVVSGSLVIYPSADDSELGAAASEFTDIAWVVKAEGGSTLISFNGAPSASASDSNANATISGTYANPVIDLSGYGVFETFTVELTVTDDTPATSDTETREYMTNDAAWFDLRTGDWTQLGLNMPNSSGITVAADNFSSTGGSALVGERDGTHGMRIKANSGNAHRVIKFENVTADTVGAHSWDIVWYQSGGGLNRVFFGPANADLDPNVANQLRDLIAGLYAFGYGADTFWGSDITETGVDWQQTGDRLDLESGKFYRVRFENTAGNEPAAAGTTIYYGECTSSLNDGFPWVGTPYSLVSNKPAVSVDDACAALVFYRDRPYGNWQYYSVVALGIDMPSGL